jgi:glyoxylase-like metal-dependent hydrolase (beta-lactamase superfamily II)
MSESAMSESGFQLPVRTPWFERRNVGDGITLLTEPAVHRFLRCNIWLVSGRDVDLLVDTGMGIASLAAELGDLAGRNVLAVATHFHHDHVGGLAGFARRAVHHADAPLLMAHADDKRSLAVGDIPAASRARIRAAGYVIEEELFVRAIPDAAYSVETYSFQTVAPTQLLTEGDVIDLGDRSFEVIELPGHSPGSIGLWERATGTLFSGDAVYDGPLLDSGLESDIRTYVATMQRLKKLPVQVVHAGHDDSFGSARLHELADAYLKTRS